MPITKGETVAASCSYRQRPQVKVKAQGS